MRPAEEEEEKEEEEEEEGLESCVELLVLKRKGDESEKSKREWRSVSSLSRCSFYLLYCYKSTNTDAECVIAEQVLILLALLVQKYLPAQRVIAEQA